MRTVHLASLPISVRAAWGIPAGGVLLFEIEVLEIAGQRLTNLNKKKIKVGGADSLKEEV